MPAIFDLDRLVDAVSRGSVFTYRYFWGHRAPAGPLTEACLSQWWPCRFVVDGQTYSSAEQFMMAGKAKLFGDEVTLGNVAKFEQDDRLRKYLLECGDEVFVEASPTDHVWGIGLRRDDPRALDPRTWQGLNLLGFALVRARSILRGEEDRPTVTGEMGPRPARRTCWRRRGVAGTRRRTRG